MKRAPTVAVVMALVVPGALAQPAAGEGGWRAERVAGEVLIQDHDMLRALVDGAPLARRAVLRLPDADTLLTMSRNGARLRSRGPAQLVLRDDLPPQGVPKVALSEGAVRAVVPAGGDLRLTAGGLRVRVAGAEAWLASDADGDEVCVLRGRVEVQTSGSTQTRALHQVGACLQRDPEGRLHEHRPLLVDINRRLARADGGLAPLYGPLHGERRRAAATEGAGGAVAADAAHAARGAVTASPGNPALAAAAASGTLRGGQAVHRPAEGSDSAPAVEQLPEVVWYVVLGAYSHRHLAERVVETLPGVGARLLAAPNAGVVRIAIGPYEDRRIAAKVREGQRSRFPGAWLLEQTTRSP